MSKLDILDHFWLLSSLISNLSLSPIETTSWTPLQSPVLPIPSTAAVVMASSFSPWTTVVSSRSGVRTGPHSSRWVVGEQTKLHLYLQPLLIICITAWALPSVMSLTVLDSHRSTNPTELESSWNHPPIPRPVHGKTVLHETAPWYQKGLETAVLLYKPQDPGKGYSMNSRNWALPYFSPTGWTLSVKWRKQNLPERTVLRVK